MLVFDLAKVEPLLAHSEQAKQHRGIYGDDSTVRPGLWLVKDHGVYLMSNGSPVLLVPGSKNQHEVVYAKGHDPRVANTWEDDRDECGADDFGEFIEAKFLRDAINAGHKKLHVKFKVESYTLTAK